MILRDRGGPAQGCGDVRVTAQAWGVDGAVAPAGHGVRSGAGTHLRPVRVERNITSPVQPRLALWSTPQIRRVTT